MFWIPPEVTPVFRCRICKGVWRETERFAFEHHIDKCFSANEQDVLEQAPARKAPFFCSDVDPEWAAYNQALKDRGLDPEVQYKRPKKSVKRISES